MISELSSHRATRRLDSALRALGPLTVLYGAPCC